MMSSIDGKITSGTGEDIFDDYLQLYTDSEDKYHVNSWLCGRVTMEMFASKTSFELEEKEENFNNKDYLTEHASQYYFFGVDTRGSLRWDSNTIKLSNIGEPVNLVIIVTKNTPGKYLAYLRQKQISYIVAGDKQIDFQLLFTKIKTVFGQQRLLLEGGGLLNGAVLDAGFVDEISLIVTPFVVNDSQAPSLFEKVSKQKLLLEFFELNSVQEPGNSCLWLRYVKVTAKEQKL